MYSVELYTILKFYFVTQVIHGSINLIDFLRKAEKVFLLEESKILISQKDYL